MSATSERVERIFKENLGKKGVSPEQKEAVMSAAASRDTLAVMPTGGGKTSIYQAVGLMRQGPTVVVSPLKIARQEQVESADEKKVPKAVDATSREADDKEDVEFFMLVPHELDEATVRRLKDAHPSFFVADEAHCISEKSHDFKPGYLRLPALIQELGCPVILGMTATASPPVRDEIIARLGMRKAKVVLQSMDRENIWLEVERFESEAAKKKAFLERIGKEKLPGMVYAATPERAEGIAKAISETGIKAAFYHEKMDEKEQERTQEHFTKGKVDVLVVTPTFSMGISKDDARFVFHYDISDSLESYYQETGRAGRDDKEAHAVVFYIPKDLEKQPTLTSGPELDRQQVERIAQVVIETDQSYAPGEIYEKTHLPEETVDAALRRLFDLGVVQYSPVGEIEVLKRPDDLEKLAGEIIEAQQHRSEYDLSRAEMMRGYAETKDCRRDYLLNYFGDLKEELCGFCDNCRSGAAEKVRARTKERPLEPGTEVEHADWGPGQVLRYEHERVTLLFGKVGYKVVPVDDLTGDNGEITVREG